MKTYREWSPTEFDCPGLGANRLERGQWIVAPTMRTRDSGPLERANFEAALETLGGESETVEIHRFGHWAVGWLEILLVAPGRAAEVEAIADRLAEYPVLDEDRLGELEIEHADETWRAFSVPDRIEWIRRHRVEPGIGFGRLLAAVRGDELPRTATGELPGGEL